MDLNRYLQNPGSQGTQTQYPRNPPKKIRVVCEKIVVARQLGLSDIDLNRYLQKSWQLGQLDTISRGSTRKNQVSVRKNLGSQVARTQRYGSYWIPSKILVARVARQNIKEIHQKKKSRQCVKKLWQLGSEDSARWILIDTFKNPGSQTQCPGDPPKEIRVVCENPWCQVARTQRQGS